MPSLLLMYASAVELSVLQAKKRGEAEGEGKPKEDVKGPELHRIDMGWGIHRLRLEAPKKGPLAAHLPAQVRGVRRHFQMTILKKERPPRSTAMTRR